MVIELLTNSLEWLKNSTIPNNSRAIRKKHQKSFVHNVGIGTNNPTEPLHLHGDNDMTFLIRSDNSTAYVNLFGGNAAADQGSKIIYSDNGNLHLGRTDDAWSANDPQMTIANNGNVGIGTASPTSGAILELYGTGTAFSSLLVPRDTTANRPTGVNGMIRYNTNLAAFEVYANSQWATMATGSGSSQWTTVAGNEIHYSTANVGIGTNNPATTLDVNGQIKNGFLSHSSANTNWNSGNIQTTSVAAPATLTFTAGSMHDGASYILILTGTAGTMTLDATGDITTWRCQPACASNQITTSGHTIVSILKAGTTGYVSWTAGF